MSQKDAAEINTKQIHTDTRSKHQLMWLQDEVTQLKWYF